jgi:glycosyltransferase involved in cell wall biosynthesis
MTRTRILILPAWYPSPDSPLSGIFVHEQAALLARDYDVAVLAPRPRGWRLPAIQEARIQRLDGVTIFAEPIRVPLPRFWELHHLAYALAAWRGERRVRREWGLPDVVHAHVVLPAGWAAWLFFRSRPIVLTEHTGPFALHLRPALKRRLTRHVLQHMTRIIAVSPALAGSMCTVADKMAIDVVGNLIRTEYFTPAMTLARASGPFRFLFVGFLEAIKGVKFLIDAVHQLMTRGAKNFELVLVGDGPLRPQLEAQAKALGVTAYCRFVGALGREQVRDQMRACDVFVLPSLQETFGVALAEAMACGKPVIATRCGGPDYVVTPETGLLVEPGSPEQLAEAMRLFIAGPHAFDGHQIRRSVEARFGEAAFLANMTRIYNDVLGRGPRP